MTAERLRAGDIHAVRAKVASVRRNELRADKVPALRQLFGLERLPLADSAVEVSLEGVPTAVVNALRRSVLDEMPGRALRVPASDGAAGFDTVASTDRLMLPQFVNHRIAQIPLRPQIPDEVAARLRFDLDVTNSTTEVMPFYSGDLTVVEGLLAAPIFNPTFKLGFLQPGKRIVIRGVHIASGRGRDDGCFMVGRRAAFRHLDIPQWDRKETHEAGGAAVDLSGYKVSCLVADPRSHILSAVIPATTANTAEVRAVFADACAHVIGRLRLISIALGRASEATGGRGASEATGGRGASEATGRRGASEATGVQFSVTTLDSGLKEGVLVLPGETSTVGELLRRYVYELYPGISFVASLLVEHEGALTVTIRDEGDVGKIVRDAIAHSIAVFETIRDSL